MTHCVFSLFLSLHRHWQKLMELTGKNFDMNPETFTLENLFTMELHNFSETISDIVGSANKELNIEKSLAEVVSTWQGLKFTVHKYGSHLISVYNSDYKHCSLYVYALCFITRYMKGTQERGYILGAVDEIVLSLDDNAMNLQSMSASRYVGPFFDRVQKWEKSLSHISEVVEVSTAIVYHSSMQQNHLS